MPRSNYDKFPTVSAPASTPLWRGWPAVARMLRAHWKENPSILALECYPGTDLEEVRQGLRGKLGESFWVEATDAMLDAKEINKLIEPWLGGDDPVFGRLCPLELEEFFNSVRLKHLRAAISSAPGPVVVFGTGALAIWPEAGTIVYADLARWEIQQRHRRNVTGNLGADNREERTTLKYKRAFFVDWRVCDRLKQASLPRWDFVLDTNSPGEPKMITGKALRQTLSETTTRPFRVAPFFDPGPWGGQWMKRVCNLDSSQKNFAWCFDCVPEENSLLINVNGTRFEIPALDLVYAEPEALLGEAVYGRFGAEFPIRFDFLDTIGGGNLSLQVHPTTDYARQHFGLGYTQDESYYILDAEPGATVYLGRRTEQTPEAMFEALAEAQKTSGDFTAEKFAANWPAKKHDHFLIPAGTLHCSGAGCMVLEISASPYIFTFKLWDWNRLGLDGRPRPIHLAHGQANLAAERDAAFTESELINRIEPVAKGRGWREERTGLHAREFIETRRHWFSGPVKHDTKGGVNVLNLVEGAEAVVESPAKKFAPFVVHYAETFIVPAEVGAYTIRPHGQAKGKTCATIKAFVRTQP